MSAAERSTHDEVEAYDWHGAYTFKKTRHRPAQTCEAVRFLCESDKEAQDESAAGAGS